MKNQINYDKIAAKYNRRYKTNSLKNIFNSLNETIQKINPQKTLEIECGTGHWLNQLSIKSDCYGVDSSIEMLKTAKKSNTRVNLICSDANHLPFRKQQFDFIYCVNAIHHFTYKKALVYSIVTLLNYEGTFSVYGLDPSLQKDKWYVYNYFEGTLEKDLDRFPKLVELKSWMKNSGLKKIEIKLIEKVNNTFNGNEVFTDSFLQKNQSSQLSLLSEDDYILGINKIKSALNKALKRKKIIKFPVILNFYLIKGELR